MGIHPSRMDGWVFALVFMEKWLSVVRVRVLEFGPFVRMFVGGGNRGGRPEIPSH